MVGYHLTNVAETERTRAIQWFENVVVESERRGASDIHLASGCAPYLRVNGKLERLNGAEALSVQQLHVIAEELLTGCERGSLDRTGAIDGSVCAGNGSRFRFNIFRKRSGLSIAFRRLESKFRTLSQLGLPETLYRLCDLSDGLVIMAGPAGAGKSTTLATLLDRMNHTREAHIITIEDPVEFVHEPIMCLINQRQVGIDASSFSEALVSAIRQDPDVIMVGEMRDENTVHTAVTAAETGHLVFATMHAANSIGALERLLGVLPAHEQESMRGQLAAVLRAVVVQHLLLSRNAEDWPRASDRRSKTDRRQNKDPDYRGPERRTGRDRRADGTKLLLPACEILFSTPAIVNLIASGQFGQVYQYIESGAEHGMQTLEHSLAWLCASGRISESVALSATRRPKTVRDIMTHILHDGKPARPDPRPH